MAELHKKEALECSNFKRLKEQILQNVPLRIYNIFYENKDFSILRIDFKSNSTS